MLQKGGGGYRVGLGLGDQRLEVFGVGELINRISISMGIEKRS